MSNREKIIERVKRLMALADQDRNPSETEVFEALSKARSLMAEHDISEDEIDREESEDGFNPKRWNFTSEILPTRGEVNVSKWESFLAWGVCKITHTRACMMRRGGRGGYIKIYGEAVDVGIAVALSGILSRHARRLAEEKYRTKRDRRSYLEGFASGVQRQAREKVKLLSADSASKYAIVSVKKEDWMLAKYREATGSDGQGKTVTSDTNPHAYFAGQKDGYSAQTEYRQKALAGGGS